MQTQDPKHQDLTDPEKNTGHSSRSHKYSTKRIPMKIMLISLLACCALPLTMTAQELSMDPALKKPDIIPAFKRPHADLAGLQQIINNKDWLDFYNKQIRLFLKEHGGQRIRLGDFDVDDLNVNFWLLYYIAAAPVFPADYDETKPERFVYTDRDIHYKDWIAVHIQQIMCYHIDRWYQQFHYPINKKDLTELSSLYFAHILRSFHQAYNKDLANSNKVDQIEKEHKEKLGSLFEKATPEEFDSLREREAVFLRKLNRSAVRNALIQGSFRSLEDSFVEMLVANYSGNAKEVFKYIRMAGYEGDKAGELIDRTVGRTAQTEYLYKGENGRRHDKKVKAAAEAAKKVKNNLSQGIN